ncbi:MAG TPA: glycosyltransferase family 39 protein [Terriglobales bacterium]|nr:glycosyltransferase family 39 protein [Terriglobales bacterium]
MKSWSLPVTFTGLGLIARLAWAHSLFLNADEALHYLLSTQATVVQTYRASLTTVHPPLLILLLHYWGWLGTSEFVLRLPSVLAGTAFCWLMYRWLDDVTDRETAFIGLCLLLFCPALIYVSAEIRQYALLMFFLSASLYCLERALQQESQEWMVFSFIALLLGISTHYSSLLFALATGVYALLRFRSLKTRASVLGVWIAGEVLALSLVAFYVVSHVLPLQQTGFPQTLADSYLRGSIFHRGEDHFLFFILRSNVRVFHYLFSQGAMGGLGLLLFWVGVILLFRGKAPADSRKPVPWQLGVLLVLPFIANCAVALAGAYPYGGTRHNSYLAGFAMSGVAVAVTRWNPPVRWAKPAALVIGLAICNLTVLPGGVYMKPREQRIALMRQAMQFIEGSVPPGSVLLTDLEGNLALDYYLCHSYTLLHPPFQPFFQMPCGKYRLIFQDPRQWIFRAPSFPGDMQTLQSMYGFGPGTKLWFFQAGFVVDKEPELRELLRERYGCSKPHEFGANIFTCEITLR